LLIWDFDGTLGYREGGAWTASLLEVLQEADVAPDVTEEDIRPHLREGFPWHTPLRPHPHMQSTREWWEALYPVFERAFENVGIDGFEAYDLARQVRAAYLDLERWRLFDDTLPTLEHLSSQGWTHVILSNHAPELDLIVQHLGLNEHMARVYNSATMGWEKPHERAFRIVLDGFPGAEVVWMIGDHVDVDIQGAAAVGIPGMLVRRYHEDAPYYCETLSQVPLVLEAE
ncbi:MAG: HAD-IA family hydrolase, partial [Chloroflexota bacterium]|nr:HAD-IA family hydrolase [Chloroflexota bacterium]